MIDALKKLAFLISKINSSDGVAESTICMHIVQRKKVRKRERKKESKEKERKTRRVKLEGYLNKIEKAETELHKLKRKEVLNTRSEKGNNNIEFKINKEKK